jgi:elongation of very long chain fatty acids protein 6
MIVGLIVNIHSYFVIKGGGECHRPISNIYAALALYASYFVLFAHFFNKAYMKKVNQKRKEQ